MLQEVQDLSDLKEHESTHKDRNKVIDEPFSCKICDMKFLNNDEMRNHGRSHFRNERISACQAFNESFARSKDLRSHKKAHKEKQYSCPPCDKRFEDFVAISEHTCPEKEHALINAHVMEVIEKFGTV